MDRRESPWTVAKDPPSGGPSRPGAPLADESPRAHSLEWPRLILLVVVGVGLTAGAIFMGRRIVGHAAFWLARQPTYQVSFREIELVEEPPAWFKGGERAFLEGVRKAAGMPERFSTLETSPDQLLAAFREAPWVEEAIQATYSLGRVQVRVVYQHPAAYVQLEGGDQYLVDSRATVLAPDDVDSEHLGPIARILGTGLGPPIDSRPGVVWKSEHAGSIGPDPRIVAAARLAGFLERQANPRTPRIARIIVSDFEKRGLFVETDRGLVIWWRSAPGDERPDEPTAATKWAMLAAWASARATESLPEGDYMAFASKGLVQKCSHPGRTHLGASSGGTNGLGDEP